jgi:hypothetical protein
MERIGDRLALRIEHGRLQGDKDACFHPLTPLDRALLPSPPRRARPQALTLNFCDAR